MSTPDHAATAAKEICEAVNKSGAEYITDLNAVMAFAPAIIARAVDAATRELREEIDLARRVITDDTRQIVRLKDLNALAESEAATLRARVAELEAALEPIKIAGHGSSKEFAPFFEQASKHPEYWTEGIRLAQDRITALESELSQATKERDALREDKDRLDWLEDDCHSIEWGDDKVAVIQAASGEGFFGKTLRAAIDAARTLDAKEGAT